MPDEVESRDIRDANEVLQEAWPKIKAVYKTSMPGYDLMLTCTWRSISRQQELYARGRTVPGSIVTWVDGISKKSNHNYYPARAIDVVVTKNGKALWDHDLYLSLIEICKSLNLTSGGSWNNPDFPHIELKDA